MKCSYQQTFSSKFSYKTKYTFGKIHLKLPNVKIWNINIYPKTQILGEKLQNTIY